MSRPALGRADARPRVHIWRSQIVPEVCVWSHGASGTGRRVDSAGEALEAALGDLGEQPAVIIWHGTAIGPGFDD